MYYDMVISEVSRDVKAEAVTFHLQPARRADFMRPDLVLQMRGKEKEANKSGISLGTRGCRRVVRLRVL